MRMFVAAYPPPESAAQMHSAAIAAVDSGGDNAAWRFTPVGQIHLTLLFIGEVGQRELADAAESIERAAAGIRAFELTPRELVTLPERGEARVLAIATDLPPMLAELQKRLAIRLARPGQRTRERYLPHFTMARAANERRAERIKTEVHIEAFMIREIRLMRSELRAGGAVHRIERACALAEE